MILRDFGHQSGMKCRFHVDVALVNHLRIYAISTVGFSMEPSYLAPET